MTKKKSSWLENVEKLDKGQMLKVLGTYLYDGYAEYSTDQLKSVLSSHIQQGDIPPYAVDRKQGYI